MKPDIPCEMDDNNMIDVIQLEEQVQELQDSYDDFEVVDQFTEDEPSGEMDGADSRGKYTFSQLLGRARVEFALSKLNEATASIEKALKINAFHMDALFLALRIYHASQNTEKADKILECMLEQSLDEWTLTHYGRCLQYLVKENLFDDTFNALMDRLHRSYPFSELHSYFKSIQLEKKGALDEAISILEKAVNELPTRQCSRRLMDLYFHIGKLQECKKVILRVLSDTVEPSFDPELLLILHKEFLVNVRLMFIEDRRTPEVCQSLSLCASQLITMADNVKKAFHCSDDDESEHHGLFENHYALEHMVVSLKNYRELLDKLAHSEEI